MIDEGEYKSMNREDRSTVGPGSGNTQRTDLLNGEIQDIIRQTVQQTLREAEYKGRRTGHSGTEEETKTVDLIGLFFFVLEKFWCVLLSAILFASVFNWGAARSVPTYTATSKLYIVNATSASLNIYDLQLGSALTMDYQEVFRTWEVHEMVREELDLPYSYEELQSMLTVANPEDTRILYITVQNTNAQLAADIANAYAKAAKTFIMNTMKSEQPSDFSIALVPGTGYKTSRAQATIMGFLLGSVLAVGILTLIFVLDNSPKTPEDINKYAGLPTLAILPAFQKTKKSEKKQANPSKFRECSPGEHSIQFMRFPKPDIATAEGLNTLVINLSYCGSDIRKVMITSRFSGEGKSYVTMNLMRTLAGMKKKVVVVDTDLRASGIQTAYGLRYGNEARNGLSEYLAGICSAEDVIYQTDVPNAWIVPAGHHAPNPLQLLDTEKMHQFVDSLAEQYDIVLLDTPPVGVMVDAIAMAKFCDGAVLVVGYHQGKISEINDAVKNLRKTGCPVLGGVLNQVRLKSLSNQHYYYHTKRYSGYYQKKRRKM